MKKITYSSLYEETNDHWSDEDNDALEAVREHNQSFNAKLYDVVTDDVESDNLEEDEEEDEVVVEDEDAAYQNRLAELQRKYGSKMMSQVEEEDFRFSLNFFGKIFVNICINQVQRQPRASKQSPAGLGQNGGPSHHAHEGFN